MKGWIMDSRENLIAIDTVKKKNKIVLTIYEQPNDSNLIIVSDPKLDDVVNWAVETLSTWKSVRRTAWNMWEFKPEREAEKFITLYHLVWAK